MYRLAEEFVSALKKSDMVKIKEYMSEIDKRMEYCIVSQSTENVVELYEIINSIQRDIGKSTNNTLDFYLGYLYAHINILGLIIAKRRIEDNSILSKINIIESIKDYLVEYGETKESILASNLGLSGSDVFLAINSYNLNADSDIVLSFRGKEIYYSLAESVVNRIKVGRSKRSVKGFTLEE